MSEYQQQDCNSSADGPTKNYISLLSGLMFGNGNEEKHCIFDALCGNINRQTPPPDNTDMSTKASILDFLQHLTDEEEHQDEFPWIPTVITGESQPMVTRFEV